MRSDVLNSSSNSYGQAPETYRYSAKTAGFTAAAGFCYLVTDADGCAVVLPAPEIGVRIKVVLEQLQAIIIQLPVMQQPLYIVGMLSC